MTEQPTAGIFNMSDQRLRELHLYKELMTPEERQGRYTLLKMAGAPYPLRCRARDWSPPHFQQMLDSLLKPNRPLLSASQQA